MPRTIHSAIYQELVAELVSARLAAGLTQQEIADRLGKPQSYVAKVEGNERRLDVIELMVIAEVIGFDPIPALTKIWKSLAEIDHKGG